MSEDFENALSDALDHVAAAARPVGPNAARIRGGNRAMRQKIALSAVSLVLVAVGATTAATLASQHNGAPQLTGATPRITTSASGNGSPSTGPSASPTRTATQSTASGPASSGPSDTGSTSMNTSQSVSADPHEVETAAWLSGGEMPFASTMGWKSVSSSTISEQQLTPTVGYVANNTSYQALTVCGDPSKFLQQTVGAQVAAFDSSPASTGNNQAAQFVFFFGDAAAAQQGYSWLRTQYTSNCSGITGTGAQVTQVGSDGSTGRAWLTQKASSGLPDLPLYEREYFVLRGDTIAYVSVTSYPHALAKSYDDAGVLSTIASHLCVYGGSCS